MSATRITLGYQTQTVRIELAQLAPLLELTLYDVDEEEHGVTVYIDPDDAHELAAILERFATELRPA